MKAIFDTSSFECIMKHYIPIDRGNELKSLIEENFKSGEFIIIDKVFKEICNYNNGIVFTEFPFLKDNKIHAKTNSLIPSLLFFNSLNDFVDQSVVVRKKLLPAAVELAKNNYLNETDGRLLLYAESIFNENPIIITEESVKANDGKVIRKIPYNSAFLNLTCCSFPTLLKDRFSINISRE